MTDGARQKSRVGGERGRLLQKEPSVGHVHNAQRHEVLVVARHSLVLLSTGCLVLGSGLLLAATTARVGSQEWAPVHLKRSSARCCGDEAELQAHTRVGRESIPTSSALSFSSQESDDADYC